MNERERRRVMHAAARSAAHRHGFDDHRPRLARPVDVDDPRHDERRAAALWQAIADTAAWAGAMSGGLGDRRVVSQMRRMVDALDRLLDERFAADDDGFALDDGRDGAP